MTIAKLLSKITSLLLLFVLLALSLLSCHEEQVSEPPFELLEEEEELPFEEESFSLYRIVVSSACSPTLWNAAKELKERISKQTGVPCEIVYDTESVKQAKDIVELLLGNTTRSASQSAMKELRENDYLCLRRENTLVLGGLSDTATLAALTRFYHELFDHVSASSLLPNEAGFFYRAEYPINTITLGGFDLALYDIVYPKNASSNIIDLARLLQNVLSAKASYSLDIFSEDAFAGTAKRIELTLSETESIGTARIQFDNQGVTLSAKDVFGLSAATKELVSQLLTTTEENVSFGSPNTVKLVAYENPALTIASLRVDSEADAATEVTNMSDLIQTYSPTVFLAENMSEIQQTCLSEILQDQYHRLGQLDVFQKGSPCRLQSVLSETATLYHIGNDSDGYLLLSLTDAPTDEIWSLIGQRTLPLLLVVHSMFFENAPIDTDFERVLFESYGVNQQQSIFAVYAEENCFSIKQDVSQNGYRSFAVERTSAFYP